MDLDSLRAALETDLPGPALQVFLTAAEEAVAERLGPVGPVTEVFRTAGPALGLATRALEILSVVEGDGDADRDDGTLDPSLYSLRPSGMVLDLAPHVANRWRRWRRRFIVTYQRPSDAGERNRVITQLVKLDIANKPGVDSVQFGSWRETYARTPRAYADEREALLDSLSGTSEGFIL